VKHTQLGSDVPWWNVNQAWSVHCHRSLIERSVSYKPSVPACFYDEKKPRGRIDLSAGRELQNQPRLENERGSGCANDLGFLRLVKVSRAGSRENGEAGKSGSGEPPCKETEASSRGRESSILQTQTPPE